jgi:hypothetical protein
MRPPFVSAAMADKLLRGGKTLIFLRCAGPLHDGNLSNPRGSKFLWTLALALSFMSAFSPEFNGLEYYPKEIHA